MHSIELKQAETRIFNLKKRLNRIPTDSEEFERKFEELKTAVTKKDFLLQRSDDVN